MLAIRKNIDEIVRHSPPTNYMSWKELLRRATIQVIHEFFILQFCSIRFHLFNGVKLFVGGPTISGPKKTRKSGKDGIF